MAILVSNLKGGKANIPTWFGISALKMTLSIAHTDARYTAITSWLLIMMLRTLERRASYIRCQSSKSMVPCLGLLISCYSSGNGKDFSRDVDTENGGYE